MGGSSDLCALLKPGEPVILMGPTGTPTEIHAETTVALVGGGLGNAVLFSIGAATRAAGSKVIYFAGYKAIRDRYKVEEIERAADVIVWCCDEAPGFTPKPDRPQDRTFVGNIVQAMAAYGSGALGDQAVPLADAKHMIVIGSDRMMQAVGAARHGVLAPFLKPGHTAIGSINSPMQCMMKEVCAQCLQPQIDPVTGDADGGVLLLQPGSGAGPGGFLRAARAAGAERHAGEADRAVDRPGTAALGRPDRRRSGIAEIEARVSGHSPDRLPAEQDLTEVSGRSGMRRLGTPCTVASMLNTTARAPMLGPTCRSSLNRKGWDD